MKLSVITINLNDAEGLQKTLRSVWERQSFTDFEHIVIDGASTDGSVEVIKKYFIQLLNRYPQIIKVFIFTNYLLCKEVII